MAKKKDEAKKQAPVTKQEPKEPEKTAEELAAENLAGWQRALADYENLKKTAAAERVEFAKYATAGLIEDLLPTIDYFDAAMRQAPDLASCDDGTRKNIENWLVGMQHVQKLLMDKLAEQGLQAVEPTGMFDPNTQEAVDYILPSTLPEGSIQSVVQRGFELNGKLIRPAKVYVVKNHYDAGAEKVDKE